MKKMIILLISCAGIMIVTDATAMFARVYRTGRVAGVRPYSSRIPYSASKTFYSSKKKLQDLSDNDNDNDSESFNKNPPTWEEMEAAYNALPVWMRFTSSYSTFTDMYTKKYWDDKKSAEQKKLDKE